MGGRLLSIIAVIILLLYLLLADLQFSRFCNFKLDSSMQASHKTSNHTPKFSLNKRVWPTKIGLDAGAKIACGRETGSYYITSDGLIYKVVMLFFICLHE